MGAIHQAVIGGLGGAAFDPVEYFGDDLAAMFDARIEATRWQTAPGAQLLADTADDPVGLMMDALTVGDLGSELAVNGTFDADSDWTKGTGWSIGGGVASYSGNASANYLSQALGEQYKLYRVSADFVMTGTPSNVTAFIRMSVGGNFQNVFVDSAANLEDTDTFSLVGYGLRINAAAPLHFRFGSHANYQMDFTVDNASMREVPGVHAYTITAGFRPLFKTSPVPHLDFDGSDDLLAARFPNLGSACTVATISSAGAVTLTGGETISGVYSLPTNDWMICMVIDRALTSGEETDLTAWLEAEHAAA